MVKKIIWSAHSVADRLSILDYWNNRIGNKNYSKRLDRSFKKAIKLIQKYPHIGRKFKDEQTRFFIRGDYLIFYKVNNNIEILHIWDSRRNPEDLKL